MAESANELAVSVGIGDVSAVLAASKNIDAMHTEALIALEENSDVGFDQAVEAVNECAKRFVQVWRISWTKRIDTWAHFL